MTREEAFALFGEVAQRLIEENLATQAEADMSETA